LRSKLLNLISERIDSLGREGQDISCLLRARLVPSWCQDEAHWTSKLTQDLFTDCPCCLLFRGLTLGFLFGMTAGIIVAGFLIAAIVAVVSR
jgi:hypothetical protein